MRILIASAAVAALGLVAAANGLRPAAAASTHCVAPGVWVDPAHGAVAETDAIAALSAGDIVLLGEVHDDAAHHRWRRDVLAALHAVHPDLIMGVEWLPRAAQPALDAYIAGDIDEATFLSQSNWAQVWGFDFALYRPIFEWARAHRVPIRAINVERAFVRAVARQGWDAAAANGAPIDRPAALPAARQAQLAAALGGHHGGVADPVQLNRMIEAQLVWDRAMAEGLAAARQAHPHALVVGLMGLGHVEGRDGGIRHQLQAMGVGGVVTATPFDDDRACSELTPDLADFAYGVR